MRVYQFQFTDTICSCCYELFLVPSSDGQKRQLGRQLLDACERGNWQEARSLIVKGEWTKAERHREVMFS